MTVTLELSPEAEADLRERAARRGQTVTDYLLTLARSEDPADAPWWEDEADRADAIAIIRQGLADLHAGDKGMLLEDYRAQVLAEREARQRQAGETGP